MSVIAETVRVSSLINGSLILHDGVILEVRSVGLGGNKDMLTIKLCNHAPLHVRWDASIWVKIGGSK